MQVGFSVLSRDEHVEFRFFGDRVSNQPRLVTFAGQGDQCLALMGRLHYRRELLAKLPNSPPCTCSSSDAELALAAYRQWGSEGIARLEGDFSLVVWDARKNLLVGSRDPMGGYPLYWTENNGQVALGTTMRPLLDLLPRRSLNRDYLADYLTLPALAIQEVPSEQCAYEGIHRVAAGTMVEARVTTGSVKKHTYWDWLEQMVDPGTDQTEAISDQFADRFRRAVRERLRGRTASHLSGGMDSTAVSLIARDCLRSGGSESPLHTLSLVYEKLAGLARETSYIESALREQPGIVAHRIPGDELLDYDSLIDPPFHDEPCACLRGLGIDRVLVETAVQVGAETMLTGIGADDILDVFPYRMTDMLRRGRIWAAWREACRWAGATNNHPWHFLYRFGIANLLPAGLRAGLGPMLHRGFASWEGQGPGTIAPWILPGFARSYALRRRGLQNIRRLYSSCRPVGLSLALAAIKGYSGDNCRWSLAAPLGMAVAHPFLDPRVLCLGLGIQARYRQEPGKQKPILAHAMRDVLPEQIRNRRRKGHFNEVYFGGLVRHLPALEAMIRQAPLDDLGLLDKDILIKCLNKAALGVAHTEGGSTRLDLALSLIKWLSMQSEWQQSTDPPVETIRVAGQDVFTKSEPVVST